MKYVLEHVDPSDATVTVETWTHPIREIAYVALDLGQPYDTTSRNLHAFEARELAQVLLDAASEAEALA